MRHTSSPYTSASCARWHQVGRAGRQAGVSLCRTGCGGGFGTLQVGHQGHHREAGQGVAWRTTSAASAICGSRRRGAEGADLDLAQAAACRAPIQTSFCAVVALTLYQAVARGADFADGGTVSG